MIVLLDQGGPFTGGLLHDLAMLGAQPEAHADWALATEALAARATEGLVLVCSPATPSAVVHETLRRFAGRMPILGIGPGHQALAEAYGARLIQAPRLLHGTTSPVLHRGRGLFAGLENPFAAARYHARVVERESLPGTLEVTAWTPEGEIMGLRHRDHDSWGVQFPPQSILTRTGPRLIENFLTLCRQQKEVPR